MSHKLSLHYNRPSQNLSDEWTTGLSPQTHHFHENMDSADMDKVNTDRAANGHQKGACGMVVNWKVPSYSQLNPTQFTVTHISSHRFQKKNAFKIVLPWENPLNMGQIPVRYSSQVEGHTKRGNSINFSYFQTAIFHEIVC